MKTGDKKETMRTDYLIIGKVLRPFGVHGEIKVLPITDRLDRFRDLEFIFLRRDRSFLKFDVEAVRLMSGYAQLKLKGYDERNDVDALRGKFLYIDRENAVKIEEDSYYYYDILGCSVITLEGKLLGRVFDIQNAGSNDVYFVRSQNSENGEFLIPAISDVVKEIDIAKKEIVIRMVDGLL